MFSNNFNLINPIAFVDVASTSLELTKARIVRISVLKVSSTGSKQFKSHLINPQCEIPEEATMIHLIRDEDVKNAKPFNVYAKSLSKYLSGCDLIGFGIKRYGLPLIRKEFRRSRIYFPVRNRIVVDLMQIYHQVEPRNFIAAFNRFAGSDIPLQSEPRKRVEGMVKILKGQLKDFPEIPRTTNGISKWSRY